MFWGNWIFRKMKLVSNISPGIKINYKCIQDLKSDWDTGRPKFGTELGAGG